jgi:hypothetical protein
VWKRQPKAFRRRAVIDADGTVAGTTGEKKFDMDFHFPKKVWGYHPLLVSLANTREPLFLVNRPGNVVSHQGAAAVLDEAVALVSPVFESVLLRGDTDFSLTVNFDRWSKQGVAFVFGFDAHPKLVALAEEVPSAKWRSFRRPPRYEAESSRRKRPPVKERLVEEKGWRNLVLKAEHITEFAYRPGKCRRPYRMIVLRKKIDEKQGQKEANQDARMGDTRPPVAKDLPLAQSGSQEREDPFKPPAAPVLWLSGTPPPSPNMETPREETEAQSKQDNVVGLPDRSLERSPGYGRSVKRPQEEPFCQRRIVTPPARCIVQQILLSVDRPALVAVHAPGGIKDTREIPFPVGPGSKGQEGCQLALPARLSWMTFRTGARKIPGMDTRSETRRGQDRVSCVAVMTCRESALGCTDAVPICLVMAWVAVHLLCRLSP